MESTEKKDATIEMAESIESKYRVNYVDSGLSRWLIEAAFLCYLLQAVCNWTPLLHWMESHAPTALAIIQTFGAVVMYIGLLRGMKPLYRPYQVWWWLMIALNLAGFVTTMIPALMYSIGLPIAVSLMLVYLPFGCLIAFSYLGRLRHVGIWMGTLYSHLQHRPCAVLPDFRSRVVYGRSAVGDSHHRRYRHLCLGSTQGSY